MEEQQAGDTLFFNRTMKHNCNFLHNHHITKIVWNELFQIVKETPIDARILTSVLKPPSPPDSNEKWCTDIIHCSSSLSDRNEQSPYDWWMIFADSFRCLSGSYTVSFGEAIMKLFPVPNFSNWPFPWRRKVILVRWLFLGLVFHSLLTGCDQVNWLPACLTHTSPRLAWHQLPVACA